MTKRNFAQLDAGPGHELLFSFWISGRRFLSCGRNHRRWRQRRFSPEPGNNQRFAVFVLGAALRLLRANPRSSQKEERVFWASAGILGLWTFGLRASRHLSQLEPVFGRFSRGADWGLTQELLDTEPV
jgi:hypothetical protein